MIDPRCRPALAVALAVAITSTSLGGCALVRRRPTGVPVDTRPTPPAPSTEPSPQTRQEDPPPPETPTPAPPRTTIKDATSETDRRAVMRRIVADTTEASRAVGRCARRQMYPDQESVYDSALGLLVQTRAALARDELWRAESLARKARQLASSLSCP